MRWVTLSMCWLSAGAVIAAEPESEPTAPRPAAPAPLAADFESMVAIPSLFVRPDQPFHGPLLLPSPAQAVAMLEAGEPLFGSDPRVAPAASLLSRLTEMYVEDAPRIALLTIRVVQEIQATHQAASPIEMLVGASRWKRPPCPIGNVPREFEEFAQRYRQARIEQKKDHETALSQMSMPPAQPSAVVLP